MFSLLHVHPPHYLCICICKKNTITHEPVTALFAEKLNDKEVSVLPTELLQSVCDNLTKIVKFAKTRDLSFYKTVV